MPDWGKRALPGLLLAAALLLSGCGEPTLTVNGEELRLPRETEELSLVLRAEELGELEKLPRLRAVDLSGSDCVEEILAWSEAHPEITVRYTVSLPDGRAVAGDETALDCSALRRGEVTALLECLRLLPALRELSLGGMGENGLLPEDVETIEAAFPALRIAYTLRWRGEALPAETESLDFSDAGEEEIAELLPWLHRLRQVKRVALGEGGDAAGPRLSWELVRALSEALPGAALDYRFTLYGRQLDLQAEELDYNHVKMDDQGALMKAVTACMPRLRLLDMDFCGVDDEHMAAIRDALPDTEVIWRIWFGEGYSVRTNVTKILASNPDKAGELTPENTRSLQYCTKVKYLDLGHNSYLGTIDYCAYMPDLEVLIVAMGNWSDCSALARCPKLEYAELQTSSLNDLSPLGELHNLRHLNICYDFALHDITPLYGLHGLERLWIGCLTPIPPEQVETFRALNPDCTVELESVDPTQTYWRYLDWDEEIGHHIRAPRYILLREQFGYDDAPYCYSYIENDPLYHHHK